MIDAKTARENAEKRNNEISTLHGKWFLKRAETAIEAAAERGRTWATFDADDLYVEGWQNGVDKLIELGYTVTDDVGRITVRW